MRLGNLLPMPILAVGAAFDFHAGLLKDSPAYLRRIGLMWLHRLVQEPRPCGAYLIPILNLWPLFPGSVASSLEAQPGEHNEPAQVFASAERATPQNVPYFEQMLELRDWQVEDNQCVARIKRTKRE